MTEAEKYANNSMKEWHGMSYIGTEFAEIKIKQAWQSGYEQGIRADVHTDNSEVIAKLTEENAELKKKLEVREKFLKGKSRLIVEDTFEIERLEAQIEKMKCCLNCKKWRYYANYPLCAEKNHFIACELWEMKE